MLRFFFYLLLAGFLLSVAALGAGYWYLAPQLPSIDTLKDVRLQVPLRVFTREGELISEFGEKRRVPVQVEAVPQQMIEAFLAAEDDRFYEHPGVDWQAILRAAIALVRTGERSQGGSTITMQVARNFFLTREKTYARKLNEILLALKIERSLSKPEILELYLNKIYLGHRAYGVGAAAQVYYGATLDELTLPQLAMIAGLPKAPSALNPVTNPERALNRRNYVLGRMLEQAVITPEQHAEAVAVPVTATLHGLQVEVDAPYIAEMVRADMVERYGEEAYTSGLQVYTTISTRLQRAANEAHRTNLLDYDQRHGYRGPEHHYELDAPVDSARAGELLAGFGVIGDMPPALVLAVDEEGAELLGQGVGPVRLSLADVRWARPYKTANWSGPRPEKVSDVLAVGDVVRLRRVREEAPEGNQGPPIMRWQLAQVPDVEGALVSLDPQSGAIAALVGGFDFAQSKFNRVTQARRQPGSNFKPFIYSAALEAGYTAASFVNDAPIVFDAPGLESVWRPENYSGKYYGPTRLREALAKSRNLISIRLLRGIGIEAALDHAERFGFSRGELPQNLSLSLGSGELSPMQVAAAYAVFANGGYRVEPWLVERIQTDKGEVLFEAEPLTVCYLCEATAMDPDEEPETIEQLQALVDIRDEQPRHAPRVIPAENAWIMGSMMRDVIRLGTGRRALSLGRSDLGGKTGTTNDQKDAWFSGFNSRLVTTVWVGFDQARTLGRSETGSAAALPMWIDYMRVALDGVPESVVDQPMGLVTLRIDPATGAPARAGDPNAIFETFRKENVPAGGPVGQGGSPRQPVMPEQLF